MDLAQRMTHGDWLLARIDAVEQAAEVARAALGRAPDWLEPARADCVAGRPLIEIAQDLASRGGAARSDTAAAYRAYERAAFDLRASVVRALVDDEGLSLSQVARAMGVSRQTVARLYRQPDAAASE